MRLYRYILRAHAGPFLFALFILMFIFLLQFIMKFVDQLVGKGLSPMVIIELILLNLAWMVVLAVPMSVLVATLMAFGGMSSHNEITAMKASGVSLYKMMIPVVFASCLVAISLFYFYDKILPEANHRAKTLIFDIRRKKPTFTLTAGRFSQDLPGYSILVRKTDEQSNDLEGVTIYDYVDPQKNAIITAQTGRVSFTSDYRKLIMDLENGEIHQAGNDQTTTYQRMRFEHHRIVMDAEGFDFERSSLGTFTRGERELSAAEMRYIVDSLENDNENIRKQTVTMIQNDFSLLRGNTVSLPMNSIIMTRPEPVANSLTKARTTLSLIQTQRSYIKANDDKINEHLVEIYKKYSIPFACIVFVLIGAPLGVMARRGTFGMAATLSLGFFLVYWACLIGGEKLADRSLLSPLFGMWMANIFLGILGLYLTIRIGKENPTIHFERFRKFIPRSFRQPEIQEAQ